MAGVGGGSCRDTVGSQDVVKTHVGTCYRTRIFQKPGFIMQRQNQAMNLKCNLLLVRIRTQMTALLGLNHASMS